jgi:xylose isomerase
MIADAHRAGVVAARYAGWDSQEGRAMLGGERSLADIAARVERDTVEPRPRSGRQEYLENLVNRYV